MKIRELLEAYSLNTNMPQPRINQISYTIPKELGGTGKPVMLNPQQIQQLVKTGGLTYTQQALKQVQTGRVEAPVVQSVNGKLEVVDGGDVLAALANSGQKVRVIVQQPQQAAATSGGKPAPGQARGQAPATNAPGKIAQAVGAVSAVKGKWDQGAMAANRLSSKIASVASFADRFGSK